MPLRSPLKMTKKEVASRHSYLLYKVDAEVRSSNKEEQSTYKEMLDQIILPSEHTCRSFVHGGQEYYLRKVKSSSSKPINMTALESAIKSLDAEDLTFRK